MVITNSNDLTYFNVQVYWDLSGVQPAININNLSQSQTSPPFANTKFWFTVYSPSGTPIHEGSAANPDETGDWSSLLLTDTWPTPFNSIEWSGAPYTLNAYAQDGAGNVYSITITQVICRPQGNTNLSKNPYGLGYVNLQVQCQQAAIFLEDQTNVSYQGSTGARVSSTIKVIYPIDETDNIPTPFSANNFSAVLVPITYSSNNYQFIFNSIYDYTFSEQSIVRIKYKLQRTFSVLCNIDLSPIVCSMASLSKSISDGTCSDSVEAQNKMNQITPLLFMAFMGIEQPLTGVDVAALIQEIQIISGFDCSCCYNPTGIIPQTSSVFSDTIFSVENGCGDVSGTVNVNGNNVQFVLSDISYVFALSNTIPTDAFTITPSVSGCVKTYTLNVDLTTLSTDILNTIANNATLVNLFNSIVTDAGGQMLSVDGKCVFASSTESDYIFGLSNIPASSSFAQITGITKSGVPIALTYSFNLTNLSGLEAYFNGLGLGTFVVVAGSAGAITITSDGNPYNLTNLTYKVSVTNYVATQSTTTSGFVPVTNEYAVQQIINKLCGLDACDILTDKDYPVPTIIIVDGVPVKANGTIAEDAPLCNLLSQYITAQNQVIDYVLSLGGANCESMKALFAANTTKLTAADLLFGTKGGSCAGITPLEAFQFMLQIGITDATTKTLFCDFVTSCGAGLACEPFNYFYVTVVPHSSTCSNVTGIIGTF